MNWNKVSEKIPPCNGNNELPFLMAYHSIYGVGVAWFHILDAGSVEELEEEYHDKYLCSAHFVKNRLNGNYCIDDDDEIDIFQNSPEFINLGTITHWANVPKPPKDGEIFSYE
jgi:hypothetical protein